jgi:peptide/nickel transport system permease protein
VISIGQSDTFRVLSKRFAFMIVTMFVASVVSFLIVHAAPGDYAEIYAARKSSGGVVVRQDQIDALRHELGLDRPLHWQYVDWISKIVLHGNFGISWQWKRPVVEVIGERLPLTLVITFASLLLMYLIAVPIGIYTALRQYSLPDHAFSFFGYLGLATPDFLIALILMYLAQQMFGLSAGGLFSPEFTDAAWSWAKFVDLLTHIWIPVVVLATAGTAFLIRTLRAAMLDEINKMYVTAARAGGLAPAKLLARYPVRVALNPIVSTLGWRLTFVISGTPIVGTVLALPDTGQLFLRSLLDQDMTVAGALILIYCSLTVIGTFVSDILLILLDPRIRLE